MLSMLADRLPLHQEHTVLDVAAGSGLVSMALSDRVKSITAMDMTREMMQQGKALVNQKSLTNIEFVKGFAEALPFADGAFDVVITRYSFHHFLDPQIALAEMVRVCTSGGMVVVMDLVSPPEPQLAQEYNRIEQLRDPSHTRALTFEELVGSFEAHSLDIHDSWVQSHEMDLQDWMDFSVTPGSVQTSIIKQMTSEIEDQAVLSGFTPFMKEDRIKFRHQIGTVVGIK